MIKSFTNEILDFFQNDNWLIGAINFDEDLHFSTYYIRASYPSNTNSLYPGYTKIIGIYKNFTEQYFLLKDECIKNSEFIIEKALSSPEWLSNIVDKIYLKTDILKSVFPEYLNKNLLSNLSNYELLSLYKTHDIQNKELYLYARIPEALDRGVNYFTNYLKKILIEKGVERVQIDNVFNILTEPISLSVLSQELTDFLNIVNTVKLNAKLRYKIINNPRRASLYLPNKIIKLLEIHVSKWKYLEYHGYGERRVSDTGHYISRLITFLNDDKLCKQISSIKVKLNDNAYKKQELFESLNLDIPHKKLFELYPKIGEAKLYRRYGQLRNFYYLDLLLSEISKRLKTTESVVRNLVPEEIIYYLENNFKIDNKIIKRENGVILFYSNENENLIVDHKLQSDVFTLINKKKKKKKNKKILQGVIASKGVVIGTCKVIIRPDEKEINFNKGNILVSESTDPDLLKYLKIAGGVITEQGGVTSHAAIICRELGIPTIIGVEGILDVLNDGDIVELNANTGEVKIEQNQLKPQLDFLLCKNLDKKSIGAKAYNLLSLIHNGFNVPKFILISLNKIQGEISKRNTENFAKRFELYVSNSLELKSSDKIAIRSSSIYEDNNNRSLAGDYESIMNVELSDLYHSLINFININKKSKSNFEYKGAIIIQKMLNPQFSGVCLINIDDYNYSNSQMIIEFTKGNNFSITSGKHTPSKIVLKIASGDILSSDIKSDDILFNDTILNILKKDFIILSEKFGRNINIEWAYEANRLYILQVRPIVMNKIQK